MAKHCGGNRADKVIILPNFDYSFNSLSKKAGLFRGRQQTLLKASYPGVRAGPGGTALDNRYASINHTETDCVLKRFEIKLCLGVISKRLAADADINRYCQRED